MDRNPLLFSESTSGSQGQARAPVNLAPWVSEPQLLQRGHGGLSRRPAGGPHSTIRAPGTSASGHLQPAAKAGQRGPSRVLWKLGLNPESCLSIGV